VTHGESALNCRLIVVLILSFCCLIVALFRSFDEKKRGNRKKAEPGIGAQNHVKTCETKSPKNILPGGPKKILPGGPKKIFGAEEPSEADPCGFFHFGHSLITMPVLRRP